jgi:hypothetical protein
LEKNEISQSIYDSKFAKQHANVVFYDEVDKYLAMSSFLNETFLKHELYNSVPQTLEKMRKLHKYYGCPKSNAFKDWTNYQRLIRSLIYILHKDSITTPPGENISKLYRALSHWTTYVFFRR